MGNVFFEITIVLCLAAFLSVIFRLLKQPPILAYILTGIIIGPFGQLQLGSKDLLQTMGEFGITLLLFMMGLEMKLKELHLIGKTALLLGIIQIVFTGVLGYIISAGFGFSQTVSFYTSIALMFSSTIIIIKILSDKKDLNSLYGKISIGLLLIQDFLAVFILIFLSSLHSKSAGATSLIELININDLSGVLIKGFILFFFVIYLSKTILPKFIDTIAKSQETLFLFSVAWVFGMAAMVSSPFIGFSIEIGGFLAGIALANASENFQIIARMRALRDFFVTIFFVFLGMRMVFTNIGEILMPILALSAFVLVVKPLIVMGAMGFLGYSKRTSFSTALTATQISEFSLIIIFLGNKLGHISGNTVSLLTGVGIITFVISVYMLLNANGLYKILSPHLWFFERKHLKKEHGDSADQDLSALERHVVLIGANRMGQSILDAVQDMGEKLAVVDFDPEIVNLLKEKKIASIFGDIADPDIQDRINLNKAKLVISTVSDLDDNIMVIKGLNKHNRTAKIIVMAQSGEEAKVLYKAGADYVVLPHLSGGRHVAKILKDDKLDDIHLFKSKDLLYLS